MLQKLTHIFVYPLMHGQISDPYFKVVVPLAEDLFFSFPSLIMILSDIKYLSLDGKEYIPKTLFGYSKTLDGPRQQKSINHCYSLFPVQSGFCY